MINITFFLLLCCSALAANVKIKKVLPHFLDDQGRHTLSPSLYERDAYQAHLRSHPELRTAIRFDVFLKAPRSTNLVLRMELRGRLNNQPTSAIVQTSPFQSKGGRVWKGVTLKDADYQNLGDLLAWRTTLFDGVQPVAEEKSFLW